MASMNLANYLITETTLIHQQHNHLRKNPVLTLACAGIGRRDHVLQTPFLMVATDKLTPSLK